MIKNIILQQQEEKHFLMNQPYIERIDDAEKSKLLKTKLIKVITGPRRAGKSVMALQLLRKTNFAYLNFDDDLLLKHFTENTVLQALHQIYPGFDYLLLDEIQNLNDWELWVNKLYRRGVNLVITGSNSRLLSHELASGLTGRFVQLPVLPFGFAEIIRVNEMLPAVRPQATLSESGKLMVMLENYLFNGGFPEVIMNQDI
ncbi:MAG: ATP-binding protein, partial [Bacteroidales bacterium]